MRFKIEIITLIALVLVFMLPSFIIAADNATVTAANADACINDSQAIMQSMSDNGFKVLSINDSLNQAISTFDAQEILKEKNRKYDFSSVIIYCDNIKTIQDDAFSARDNFDSLLKFYNDSVVPGMNTTSIDSILDEIRNDIYLERYVEVGPLVDKAYTEITTVKASYTALNVFYQSTAKGFNSFLSSKDNIFQTPNYIIILIILVILIVAFFIYRVRIIKIMLVKKLRRLINRKATIKSLIMKAQKGYFQYNTVPEGEYNIKTKRFAELIRDLDRQIPLVEEEIMKLGGGSRKLKQTQEKEFEDLIETGEGSDEKVAASINTPRMKTVKKLKTRKVKVKRIKHSRHARKKRKL